jgi:2,5-diketo-D-gluconate reductase A
MEKIPTLKLNNGKKIPQLGLGVWQVPNDAASACVNTALTMGYRLVDTAAIYGNEAGVGMGLRTGGVARKDLFITTKLWNDRHRYDDALAAMDQSLKKLGLAYVDLYLIHWPVAGSEGYLEAWRALKTLQDDGRARSIGVSNFTAHHLQRLIDETGITPAVNQIELHPYLGQQSLRAFHAKHGIVTQCWSPLAQGGITQDKTIRALAQKYGKSAAQVTLSWHLQHGFSVIPKSVTSTRIRENIDLFDFELSPDDMAQIDALDCGKRLGPDPATFTG